MAFNRELAEELANAQRDRDRARYFAGRVAEIDAAESAFAEARKYTQTAFRVFTGAPGCGKSSLLTHIRESHADNPELLFVKLSPNDRLDSRADLYEAAAEAALKRPPPSEDGREKLRHSVAKHAAGAQAIGETVRIKNAGGLIRDWYAAHRLSHLTVVFVCDEAQNLRKQPLLRAISGLHDSGLDFNDPDPVRSVLLLTGLTHAKQVLDEAKISRAAHNADVDMGALSKDECVESTLAMFDDLAVEGSDGDCRVMAERAAGLSHGWPQHLFAVQQVLCRSLLAAAGALRDVDVRDFARRSDEARYAYYRERTAAPEFGGDRELVQGIVADLAGRNEDVCTDADLRLLCDEQIKALRRSDNPFFKLTPKQIADGLVRKGVVCRDADGCYMVPIPSMVTWAQEQLRGQPQQGG